ncbi:RNA 2',3'-cyclic phosphodiesterase [Opitutus terrae]|uniref:RNA 2',3'-cyclic phosphodiesterase n=1 Tax=Opitutus terrae (strain DSM 11246 / JCM 15787 / PB90-1) TaxID=452637 RepID=B1ZYS3_OPITP|nr:RNA 2',3'-cyclic phosphodiesterase [Opitutus terrae]ACB75309.1 2'-5' RNA ligase [Opitutus terrae PB90-1]
MDTQRLFIAVPLPPAVRDLVASLTVPLREVRWTRDEQLHLTLRFLGDTPVEQIDPLCARLAAIQVEPFLLPVERVGAFPPKASPRVIWVGVGSGHPRLHQLRQKIDDAVLACGLDADLRTFHPHITLGRCQDGARNGVQQWLRHHADFAGPSFRVDAFELYASELHSAGAIHHLRQRFPLGSGSTPPAP